MSFLVRNSSNRWSQNGVGIGAKSFVNRRRDSGGGSTSPPNDPPSTSSGYLLAEVREARAAVAALDRYLFNLKSFKECSFELVEQAHLAMSRLEQAVAVHAAPELILLACEIKVAARRGADLLRTYGQYHLLGKLVAIAQRNKVVAKYIAVTERLRGLMPNAGPSTEKGVPAGSGVGGAAASPFMGPAGPGNAGQSAGGGGGALEHTVTGGASSSDPGTLGNGQVLRRGHHERVYSVAFAPPAVAAASGGMCVWWALESCVEFYSDATQSTTSFAIEGDVFLTCVAIDSSGNTWGGTSRGTLLMRQPHVWDSQSEERLFSSAVRAIAFDADMGTVWAGDEHGCLRSVRVNEATGGIQPALVALAGSVHPRRGLSTNALLEGVNRLRFVRRTISNELVLEGPPRLEGPIRCVLVRAGRMWAAGGRSEPWVAVFQAITGQQLDVWRCGNHGACNTMQVLSWTLAALRRPTSSGAMSHASSSALDARGCSLGGGLLPASVPEDSVGQDPREAWQLLTGHDNGQLLVWNTVTDRLQPVCKLGEAGSPVRAATTLDAWGLICTAHANGEIAVFSRPAQANDWGGGSLSGAASHALLSGGGSAHSSSAGAAPPPIAPLHTTSVGIACVRPRRLLLRAHRGPIAAAGGCSSGLVTASNQGTLRLWRAADLASEADKAGLTLSACLGRRTTTSLLSSVSSDSGRAAGFSRQVTVSTDVAQPHHIPGPLFGAASTGGVPLASDHMQGSLVPAIVPGTAVGQAGSSDTDDAHHVDSGAAPTTNGALNRDQGCTQSQDALGHPTPGPASQQPAQQVPQEQPLEMSKSTLGNSMMTLVQPPSAAHGDVGFAAVGTSSEQQQLQQQQQQPGPSNSGPSLAWQSIGQVGSPRTGAPGCPIGGAPGSTFGSGPASPFTGAPGSPFAGGPGSTFGSTSGSPLGGGPASPFSVGPASPFVGGTGTSFGGATSPSMSATNTAAVTSYGSGPVLAPRKPRAQRQVDALQQAESRERRKSERRLSKGAQIAWSTCQIIESRELKLQSLIGSGAYGKVWLAEWMGTQVAAKELLCLTDRAKDDVSRKRRERKAGAEEAEDGSSSDSGSDSSEDSVDAEVATELKELMDEVYLLGSLSHPNIMRFCAVCLDPPMIVTQYYQHGSLFELLKKARRGDKRAQMELLWPKRLDMLRDVAAGMVFLHSRRPPVVHGDLRSPNLLLDMAFDRDKPRLHVKIADFGLACMMGPAKTLAVSKVTNPRWSAPEVIRDSSVSTSADVFSFAVVMWEVLTWQQPYEDMMSVQVLFSVMQNLRPDMPDDADLPGRPGPSLPMYKDLMAACWQEDTEERPTFEQIVAQLDEMRSADRAARAAERALAGDGATGSRRTSYSADSPMSSPHVSASHALLTTFGTDDASASAAAAAIGARAAGDSAMSFEDQAAAAAMLITAAAVRRSSARGLPSSYGASQLSEDGGQPSTPHSPHSSPGVMGVSEPSFAAFAGGGGLAVPAGSVSSAFGFPLHSASEGGPPVQPVHYATVEALRAPSRAPSRLGRGTSSAPGMAPGLPPINTGTSSLGGFGAATHSPRSCPLARSSSPFGSQQQQQQQPQEQPMQEQTYVVPSPGHSSPVSSQVQQPQQAASPSSPFAAYHNKEQQPVASPFAVEQVAGGDARILAAPQVRPPAPSSPCAAQQQQQPSSPFLAQQHQAQQHMSCSPFAVVEEQQHPSPFNHLAAQEQQLFSTSCAAPQHQQQQRQQQQQSPSPFDLSNQQQQQAPSSSCSPFTTQGHQQQSASPFAVQHQPQASSPFAAQQQQQQQQRGSSSPFAAMAHRMEEKHLQRPQEQQGIQGQQELEWQLTHAKQRPSSPFAAMQQAVGQGQAHSSSAQVQDPFGGAPETLPAAEQQQQQQPQPQPRQEQRDQKDQKTWLPGVAAHASSPCASDGQSTALYSVVEGAAATSPSGSTPPGHCATITAVEGSSHVSAHSSTTHTSPFASMDLRSSLSAPRPSNVQMAASGRASVDAVAFSSDTALAGVDAVLTPAGTSNDLRPLHGAGGDSSDQEVVGSFLCLAGGPFAHLAGHMQEPAHALAASDSLTFPTADALKRSPRSGG